MKTQGHTRSRPYTPKAIPPSYSVGLGSSATSWAPPRRAGLLRDLQPKNAPSVSSNQYMPGQPSQHILEYKRTF
ncbi:hypothetical protein Syun_000902 [Stephania yunnanensis]|uniref:Uncharacterized protein n=1 Tax=Stephania yunnanensis TaxID=152371 RepID=A0AAP0LCQ1_9MAGN